MTPNPGTRSRKRRSVWCARGVGTRHAASRSRNAKPIDVNIGTSTAMDVIDEEPRSPPSLATRQPKSYAGPAASRASSTDRHDMDGQAFSTRSRSTNAHSGRAEVS